MTEEKKKSGDPLKVLDNLSPQDWADAAERVEKAEKSSDAWLKGLIEKGERERAGQGQNGDDDRNHSRLIYNV